MKAVIQQEKTGCAIASAAVLAGVTYSEARKIANTIGIYADDPKLWSQTKYMRLLLDKLGIRAAARERPFRSWRSLPNLALLSIKWHQVNGMPYWHWVVFVRDDTGEYILDTKKPLRNHKRTDFGRIKPKWFISIYR